MPHTPEDVRKAHQAALLLPLGGTWYDSLEEAKAHPGGGYTVCVRERPHSFYGAYPSEQDYFDTAGSYLDLRAERTAEEIILLKENFPDSYELPPDAVAELALPPKGRWFLSEAGARAALELQGIGLVDNVRVELDPDFYVWCLYPSDDAFLDDILDTWPNATIDSGYATPESEDQ